LSKAIWVPKSVTLSDLEQPSGCHYAFSHNTSVFWSQLMRQIHCSEIHAATYL